ncbi:MAG: cbb3-type cytochrome oxidase assembly protein CcoS [Urechidicola sp.]|nr:cbb3-type cytochrome oxidase assembly protein CcoS [Urechidicola sp.]
MSVIYVLITVSLALALVFFFIFIKSVKSGQFDDTYTPSVRMLFDDEVKNKSPKKSITKTKLNS